MASFFHLYFISLRDLNSPAWYPAKKAAPKAVVSWITGLNTLVFKISDKILPLFLIHDAIILDVPGEYLSTIDLLCKSGLPVPILNKNFPVQIDIISQN